MPKTVLLADDSVTIQKVVGITFANEDVELVTENNGDAALARAREITPDLILADVSMPGLNGYELCAAIRSEPRLARIPVILLTGTFESFDEAKTAEVGADGHIAKPFEAQALVDLVRSTIERASRQAAPAQAPPSPAPVPAVEVPSFAPPTPEVAPAAPAAAPADPGRTEIVGLSPQEEAPPPLAKPSFDSPPPRVAVTPPTPVPSFEAPPAQPAPAAAPDPGRTEIVGLNSLGEDQEPPALEGAFADFDEEAPAGEATRVYDPAQGVTDAPLITPPAENAAPPLPSVDPVPSPGSAPPSPMPAPPTPEISPNLPPSPAMGETPPRSSGLQGADTDVDAVLYEETAFLDPRAGTNEPPPAEPLAAPVFEAPPEPTAPAPEVVPSPPPVFSTGQAPQLDAFDGDDGQRTAVLPVDAVHQMNEETAPDPGRQERAALAAAAALDDVSAPPPPLEEPPDLELSDAVVQPEPLAASDANPLADDPEPLSMSHVEMLDPPSQAGAKVAPEPAMPVAPPEPVAAAPEPPELPELELDSPIVEQPEPVDAAEVHSALEKVAWDAFGPLSEQIVRDAVRKIEEVAWEVIPQLAEKLIRDEIARLKKDD